MKIEELKHNHSLTDLLKILLFAILLLAPIGMVATRCLYVIANKNAYQSYSGQENTYTQTPVSTLSLNEIYHFDTSVDFTNTTIQNTGLIGIADLTDIDTTNTSALPNINNEDLAYIRYYYGTSSKAIYYYDSNRSELGSNSFLTQTLQFNFRLTSYESALTNNLTMLSKLDVSNESYMDNVFEYSVSQLEQSNLFNWTENTAIYSGINAMNVQLGINSPAITIILTYWLILTCIYIIIDIVLKIFTYLTHMIGSRKT